ncbi:translation initiation factor IF-2 N-terminal domain-containing protein [Williamsia deligens]|uniref:Translation initiation factor IF-2 N-terminal domain-containing protein n=1 Tax=Williamsia deligens TaxID=321325 RepID=A0ABW3GBW8_9NOCA|nr:translation initiation factor IF-2 N-terminal domain-containing protein [Williamsia deligens]MCP2195580.1 ribonuclease E [Williamsia deligens]
MADTGTPDDRSDTSPAQEFPHKMRVHALARMIGLTSREVLAHLADLGITARSPQSSIDRSAAIAVRDAQVAAADGPATSDAAATDAPAGPTSTKAPGAGDPPQGTASADPAPSLFSAATSYDAAPATPAADAAASPLFLPPPAPEEVERTRRRRPRAAETADNAETDGSTPSTPAPDAPRRRGGADTSGSSDGTVDAEKVADTTPTSGPDDSAADDSDDDSTSGGRRRRRGRRGRGRGRGDQNDSENGDETGSGGSDESASAASGDSAGGNDAAAKSDTAKSDTEKSDTEKTDTGKPDTRKSEAEKSDSEKPDTAESDTDGEKSDADDGSDDGDDENGSGTRRRRRRRRRKGGADADESGGGDDDPPNTVVHEREPRNKSRQRDRDEVQGISGSTRLEAKRQRRRDGRDAGRRRPPILTESEFLARREAVDRVMVVRERSANTALTADDGSAATEDYTQVAVLEDGVLVEHFVTTSTSSSMVGNIFVGRVQNVLPGMEAAFVDIGRGRNGVLYAGEVNWDAAGLDGGSRKIEQALKPGDHVVVQVSKDPVGHKGARLTTQISLAGRYLVYVPGGSSTGISRKLPDTERKRLKQILSKVVPAEAGVIIRTASEGVSEAELAADIERLKAQWETIEAAAAGAKGSSSGKNGGKGGGPSGPQVLYSEPDLLVKVVRDLFNEDFSKLVIDGNGAWDQVHGYVQAVAPDLLDRVTRFERAHADAPDAFAVHRIDEQLTKALERKVWLPSGGTLIIEHTEAMTVVDVNTGKFTGSGGNLEETVTRNNLEAAEEIVRQMRLRDIGGMIIVDFIDMVLESNRDLVLRRLTEALSRDRTRHQVSEVTSLGLVQMTRKRLGTGLLEAFSSTCTCCNGRGIVVHANPVEVTGGGGGDDSGRDQGGSKRSRRSGRKKSDSGQADQSDANGKAHNPAEHPMFRAMAGHGENGDGEDGGGAEQATAPDTEAEAPAERRSGRREKAAPKQAPEPQSAPETQSAPEPQGAPEPTPEPDVVAPSEPSVEPVAAGEPEQAADPAAPRRRRRAARRPASAPVGGGDAVAGTVETIVVEAPSAPTTTVVAQQPDTPVVAVRRTARRRAAGRPAGPPVED